MFGLEARIVRLRWLIKFLKSMPSSTTQVAVREDMPRDRNTTIVGDWFAAEAVSGAMMQGYRQTIFTRHAPTVQSKIELFDQEFADCLKAKGWTPRRSRTLAISTLQRLIRSLERKLRARERKRKSKARCPKRRS